MGTLALLVGISANVRQKPSESVSPDVEASRLSAELAEVRAQLGRANDRIYELEMREQRRIPDAIFNQRFAQPPTQEQLLAQRFQAQAQNLAQQFQLMQAQNAMNLQAQAQNMHPYLAEHNAIGQAQQIWNERFEEICNCVPARHDLFLR